MLVTYCKIHISYSYKPATKLRTSLKTYDFLKSKK